MKIGINTGFFAGTYNDLETIEKVAELGYTAIDYSFYLYAIRGSIYEQGDWREHLGKVRKRADEVGIEIYQMHAPLLKYVNEEVDEEFKWEMTKIAFEACRILGCHNLVIHPRKFRNYNTEEEIRYGREYNLEMYRSLLPISVKYDVHIAIENMFRYDIHTNEVMNTTFQYAQEMAEFLEVLPQANVTACVDSGHAFINGQQPGEMLLTLKDRVGVLHIHDNFKIKDSHIPPYMGDIDWKFFLEALHKIKFKGVFSFEIMPKSSFALVEEARYLLEMGKEMIAMIK